MASNHSTAGVVINWEDKDMTFKTTVSRTLAAAALVTCGMFSTGVPAFAQSEEPIRLAINEWTGQHISTLIAGEVLKRMGYNVEYVTAGYYPQCLAIADGDLDASLEIWTSNYGDGCKDLITDGNLVVIGETGIKAQEHWYVPAYVVDQCPGLPDWTALNECTDIFATADTMPSGRFLDYPADWGDTNSQRIEALGLDYVSIPSGGEGSLIAEVQSAMGREAPVLVMFWEPHWLHAQFDLVPVVLPDYYEGCETDASLGMNSDAVFDCDWPAAPVIKIANPALETSHPAVWKLLEVYEIDNAEQARMMLEIDENGLDLVEVVTEWLDAHPERVQSWIDAAAM